MSDLSMFSKVEADRILKRAAELEGSDDPGPVTLDESNCKKRHVKR